MSGHSHWATIRRSKAANDAKRGKMWSKLARRIIVAAKAGGGDPDQTALSPTPVAFRRLYQM